ncbi:hypothetical protein T11_12097 [Trichinella zimbabwensis]|uniref:Uncharacterized protein n=1 Tax=Trichinella zimbabwensis TaxID=268475 RepID=A0A0V1HVB8_9BILA|nr:hypothetical protein T11_12097 [Trichinella zimbabwensis]
MELNSLPGFYLRKFSIDQHAIKWLENVTKLSNEGNAIFYASPCRATSSEKINHQLSISKIQQLMIWHFWKH